MTSGSAKSPHAGEQANVPGATKGPRGTAEGEQANVPGATKGPRGTAEGEQANVPGKNREPKSAAGGGAARRQTAGPPLPPVPAWAMYRSMAGIGLLCGLLIVTVFQLTEPIIAKKRAEALQRAVFTVLPDARTSRTYRFAGGRFEAVPEAEANAPARGEERVYAGYGENGELVGVALEAQGMGYQDVIVVLYGYDFDAEAIVGMKVMETKETPGLGDKIETDPAFRANFERLDVALDASGNAPAHPIEVVPHGTKTSPWQIDAITGATVSSKAIGDLLARSTVRWMPVLKPQRAAFEE